MNFRKVNNITGWIVFAIASLTYIMTAEKSGSLWDTGEFISAAYKVQMPHPPGAPLFVLLGRFFIILFGDNPATAAKAVNIMNALASGATILFLFWTITHFARKLVTGFREDPNAQQVYTIMGAGIVGALAYTFTDSFWYSAVEGLCLVFFLYGACILGYAKMGTCRRCCRQ
jgi:cation transport ATPase